MAWLRWQATEKINYYIDVTDKALEESRTPDYAPHVGSQEECRNLLTASFLSSASVAVGSATGAPVVPAGFSAVGVVAGAPAAGAVGATSEGVAGSGGSSSAAAGAAT